MAEPDIMKWLTTLFLCFIHLAVFALNDPADTTINGIPVRFGYSRSIFPLSWQESPISAEGESIDKSEIPRCKAMMVKALAKYPAASLKKELSAIYFLKVMKFYDVEYGGTNSTDVLYLTNSGWANGYTNLYIEQTFHHEFSSILYRNHPSFLNEEAWKITNSEDFDYNDPENGVGAIRNNQSSQDLDTALCQEGFLTQYSLSGIENDINTFAQNIFSPSEGFWDIADRFPRIKRKLRLLIDFYHKIDPLFTESYFRDLRQ